MVKIIRTHPLRLLILVCLVAWAGSSFGQTDKAQELARLQQTRVLEKPNPQVLSKSVDGSGYVLSPQNFTRRISPLRSVPQGAQKVAIPLPRAIPMERSKLSIPTMRSTPLPLDSYKKERLSPINKRTRVD